MELLLYTPEIFVLLLTLTAAHVGAHDIRVTCTKSESQRNDLITPELEAALRTLLSASQPEEWFIDSKSSPSPPRTLHLGLVLKEKLSHSSLNIQWSVAVDYSSHSITGTWISLRVQNKCYYYRCQYKPSFSLKQVDFKGLEEIKFNVTINDVEVEPSAECTVTAINLPTPPVNAPDQPLKSQSIKVPSCSDETMKRFPECSDKSYSDKMMKFPECSDSNLNAVVENVPEKKEVKVKFTSHPFSHKYRIRLLRNNKETVNSTEVLTNGEVKEILTTLKYTGECLNLIVKITPHFPECGNYCSSEKCKVKCKALESNPMFIVEYVSGFVNLMISIGCVTAILLTTCFCLLCKLRKRLGFWKRPVAVEPVGVLVVYPPVDGAFQRSVMTLAEFLQAHGGLKVVIDMWHTGSLAQHGPLRWLNQQVDDAEKVLIVLPSQHNSSPNTGGLKTDSVPGAADYAIPASAPELFSMVLNVVASSAADPRRLRKFWVVQLSPGGGEKSAVPLELRSCRTFRVPRDLEKLHLKLTSAKGQKDSFGESSKKPQHKSQPQSFNKELVGLTEVESKP